MKWLRKRIPDCQSNARDLVNKGWRRRRKSFKKQWVLMRWNENCCFGNCLVWGFFAHLFNKKNTTNQCHKYFKNIIKRKLLQYGFVYYYIVGRLLVSLSHCLSYHPHSLSWQVPPPDDLVTSLPVPSTDSIHFHPLTISTTEQLPFYMQLCNINSKFIEVSILDLASFSWNNYYYVVDSNTGHHLIISLHVAICSSNHWTYVWITCSQKRRLVIVL